MVQQELGAVTVARVNGAFVREFAALALGIGIGLFTLYASLGFALVRHFHPHASITTVLHLLSPGAAAFADHFALGLLTAPVLVAVAAFIGWRHLLARSDNPGAVARLLRVARALCSAPRVSAAVVPGRIPAEPAPDRAPDHSILEQLCAALVISPSAPPAKGFQIQAVNTRSSISRRSLA